jgi:adenine-specific DNA methylase
MLKRLIEVALPLKEVSEQSAREKSIRHGHISTLHIWWARRPLAACRAAIFASLIPDPDDPECPPQFRTLVMDVLARGEFTPKNGEGSTVADTPRNRCLEFIKHLVRWENSNNPEYIKPARKLIAAAHEFLHPDADGDAPKVLDPFAGGGAIPLEALRLGCEAHAVDLNPVAHLIELCTLVYPQKYGQPDSRPVPDYIKRLIAHNKAKKKGRSEKELFDDGEAAPMAVADEIIPYVEITEAQYRKNPLAADVKYWSLVVLAHTRARVGRLYPPDGPEERPTSFHWARTYRCPNPTCRRNVPLVGQLLLASKGTERAFLRLELDTNQGFQFTVHSGKSMPPSEETEGTLGRTSAACPACQTAISKHDLRSIGVAEGFDYQLMAVGCRKGDQRRGKRFYRSVRSADVTALAESEKLLATEYGSDVPMADLPYLRSIFNLHVYGYKKWSSMFNARQKVVLVAFARSIHTVADSLAGASFEADYARAILHYLAVTLDRLLCRYSTFCIWDHTTECVMQVFNQGQSLPMRFDHVELNPFEPSGSGWETCVDYIRKVIEELSQPDQSPCFVSQGDARRLPFENGALSAVLTDPPYYDSVPYADCSDYFYVWLRKSLAGSAGDIFRTPTTPKSAEIAQLAERNPNYAQRTKEWFEENIQKAFSEAHRVIHGTGVAVVMYAHKTTSAWETLINGLLSAGLTVSASWPIHTESQNRMRALDSAALASSICLICRPRHLAESAIYSDLKIELMNITRERLDFFWSQGIRGADFFISAIGPALSVFGKYEKVTKLSGEEVTVGQFLDEVRSLVTSYALTKILKTTHTGTIDPESRFYVVWKWSYADAKVPADESFKLSQALGLDTESLWDKSGVLEKSSENVQATPVAKRIKLKTLGEPAADGAPASVIDVLHRMCAFREKGDTPGMVEFLGRSGHANNHSLWLIAQAVSEILPDGEKEKQLMQGLLNQKEGLEEAAREKRLF